MLTRKVFFTRLLPNFNINERRFLDPTSKRYSCGIRNSQLVPPVPDGGEGPVDRLKYRRGRQTRRGKYRGRRVELLRHLHDLSLGTETHREVQRERWKVSSETVGTSSKTTGHHIQEQNRTCPGEASPECKGHQDHSYSQSVEQGGEQYTGSNPESLRGPLGSDQCVPTLRLRRLSKISVSDFSTKTLKSVEDRGQKGFGPRSKENP